MSMYTNEQRTRVYQPSLPNDMHEAVASWFLGPQAENFDVLLDIFKAVLDGQRAARQSYHPEDGVFVTHEIKNSPTFKANMKKLVDEFNVLIPLLNEYSIPFYSPRYAGHMCFETSLPAIAGWVSTVLFNPNNVAFEASPFTTQLELIVGEQMCEMLGYDVKDADASGAPKGWGHIACDGTVANLESMWAARNLKFYPLSLRDAMAPGQPLDFIADRFKVRTCAFDRQRPADELPLFSQLDTWDLLNLRIEDILGIPDRLNDEFGISSTFLDSALGPFLIQSKGKDDLEKKWGIAPPQYLLSNTKHYSWPKSAAIAGVGSANVVNVKVDNSGRVSVDALRAALAERLERQQAVYAVVAIIGSTEEGCVDPLEDIVALRDEFQAQGMAFVVHADAAWGGYFASMLREKPKSEKGVPVEDDDEDTEEGRDFVPSTSLREYTMRQFIALKDADSITIDPHKAGYIPYPAGGLCYRDGRMRYLLTWTAPYLNQATDGESIGIYGVEGSKPGAPAVAVYMHHNIVGLHKEGHGALLGEAVFTSGRLAAHWAAMTTEDKPYTVVPFNALACEGQGDAAVAQEKAFIREHILGRSNEEVVQNDKAMAELRALGSDLNINAFVCNFKVNGKLNDDVEEANYLNNCVFDELSITSVHEPIANTKMFLSSTVFAIDDYGDCCTNFKRRLGLEQQSRQDLYVLRNVAMSPFQTAGDFVQKLADIFEGTLAKHTETVVARNTVAPQKHVFTMQGTDELFLVYRPRFHHANGRTQLILSADISNGRASAWSEYVFAKTSDPAEVFTLTTRHDMTLDDLISAGTFEATVEGTHLRLNVHVGHVQVVKQRALNSKWRDADYPARSMPFYLYGTSKEAHIDHMLLLAPNAQMSADNVKLELDSPISAEQLARGALVFFNRSEASMQPFSDKNPPRFFAPGSKFSVEVFADPSAAQAFGPGLASVAGEKRLAAGTLTLREGVYVDYEEINTQDFTARAPGIIANYTSTKMSGSVREGWKQRVKERLTDVRRL